MTKTGSNDFCSSPIPRPPAGVHRLIGWHYHSPGRDYLGRLRAEPAHTHDARTPPVDDASAELLVRLLTRHQEAIFRHIFALLPHEEDARDVLQETNVA